MRITLNKLRKIYNKKVSKKDIDIAVQKARVETKSTRDRMAKEMWN